MPLLLSPFSRVWLCATPWTVACQAPLSMGFSRQEYGSGLPCPPPGDLPDPGIEPMSLVSLALADVSFFLFTFRLSLWSVEVLSDRLLPRKCHSEVFRKGCCHGNWIGSSPPGCMGTSALMYSGCPCAAGGKRAVTLRLQKHHGKCRADKVCHERTDYSMWQGLKPRMPQSLFLN